MGGVGSASARAWELRTSMKIVSGSSVPFIDLGCMTRRRRRSTSMAMTMTVAAAAATMIRSFPFLCQVVNMEKGVSLYMQSKHRENLTFMDLEGRTILTSSKIPIILLGLGLRLHLYLPPTNNSKSPILLVLPHRTTPTQMPIPFGLQTHRRDG